MSASLRIALAAAALAASWLSPAPALATVPAADACRRHAPEAAIRSGLPVDVILRVMHAESRGRPRTVSHKGAMGCMQIMPGTWTDLTGRYGLGSDPWNPRMNMIGGALYLAELARQFGLPGAYSAYNAGPGRYLRYVRGGVPLPGETIAYAAQITGGAAPTRSPVSSRVPAAPRWQEAGIFMVSTQARPSAPVADNDATGEDRGPPDLQPVNTLFPALRPENAPRQN
jgi:soluble lytic murein transglycosylase-like protein